MNTAARVARIGTSYPKPVAANDDEDNRINPATKSLALVVVVAFCILGAVALALFKN